MGTTTQGPPAVRLTGVRLDRRYRPDIQGLRAIAVLAVIADHIAGWPSGSFVGVDIFFVISGYLITGLLVREFEGSGSISFAGFYARRVKRLLPAGMFVIGATVLFTRVLAGIDRYHFAAKDAIAAALFTANWHFAATGVNYFNQSLPPSPLQHYWSLSVEEQFYFVWPWLLLAVLIAGRRLRWWRDGRTRMVAGILISAICVASLAWAFAQTSTDPAAAYFSTFVRAWELGLGALAAVAAPALARIPSRARTLAAVSGVGGVLAALFVVPASGGFPAPWALLPVVAAAVVLATAEDVAARPLRLLTNPVSQYIGRLSYSLYLWHFPVVVLIVCVVPQYSALYWVVGPALIAGLSAASFHLLEEPARRGVWFRWTRGTRAMPRPDPGWLRYGAACAGVAALAGAAFVAVRSMEPRPLTLPAPALVGRPTGATGRCLGAAALDPAHACPELNVAGRVAPLPGALPDDTGGAYGCYAYLGQPAHPCVYGSRRRDALRVALIGDSHAAALLAALEPQLAVINWRMTAMTGQTCGWLPAADAPACRGMAAIEHELSRGRFDVVIATELRLSTNPVAEHLAAMRPVAASGARIVVVEDNPSVAPASTACVLRVSYRPDGGCGTPERVAFAHHDLLAVAAERLPGARVVQTRAWFCRNGFCPATIGNVIVYRDTAAHVTASYARTWSPYLVEAILRAIRGAHRRAGAEGG